MIGNVPGPSALARSLALVLLLAPLAAAQDDGQASGEGQVDPQQREQAQDRSGVRFANLVPEGATIDVLVDGEVVIEELAPSTVSPYVVVPAGEHAIEAVSRADLGGVEAPATEADPADPAAAPADPAAAPTEPDQAQDPAAPAPATEEPQPAPVQDAALLEQNVQLEAERYGTMILFRSASVAQEGGQDDAPQEDDAGQPDVQQDGDAGQGRDEATQEPSFDAAPDEAQQEGQDQESVAEGQDQEQEPQDEQAPPADGAQADGAPTEDAEAQAGDIEVEEQAETAPPQDGPLPLQGRLVNDELGELPGAGRAMVRVVHTAPAVGPVTVVAARADEDGGAGQAAQQDPPQDDGQEDAPAQDDGQQEGQEAPQGPAPIGGEELASALEANVAGAYASLRAGPHRLQVQVQDGTVAVDLDEVVFESGLLYTLYVAATDDAQTVVLTPAVDGGVSIERR